MDATGGRAVDVTGPEDAHGERTPVAPLGLAVLGVALFSLGVLGALLGWDEGSDVSGDTLASMTLAADAGGPFLIAGAVCFAGFAICNRLDRR